MVSRNYRPHKASIKTKVKEFKPYMDCKLLVAVDIRYPKVLLPQVAIPLPIQPRTPAPGRLISAYYAYLAQQYLDFAKNEVYPEAREAYDIQKATGNAGAFRPYAVSQKYMVVYNQFPYLSIVIKRLADTGGETPMTEVLPATFNTFTGKKVALGQFFTSENYQDIIFRVIEEGTVQGKDSYLATERNSLKKDFDPNCYNLTAKGIQIYARNSIGTAGAPAFLIPYQYLTDFLKNQHFIN